ncbi:Asparagine synthetase (glutamine-hydrolyzing) 1 [Burkholderia multivorans]|uniref:asparagine synthase (glutamine-hydrolyzing) n=1 Tax=Burkholderia multivorans TaxID=87883 RepID=UPI00285B8F4F|nr:asparagine synthase (glutamine-hydrolyzing) [Burkholderia multivorans]MDR8920233.1 Asparagine synthetase (glutamine-hydrolyzing) 1 [Burkholderia multivorans]MDR8925442.1 Asparagine synthetase (glutamine-hydrolyzing) 1 [Burkholderia multivorans]MDR8964565.1 Asparagine synthetase (glutamine-hydrolyzing) 1 [Burkholderia multivorans]MDR8991912.1 Asparagine synthetase (glutamine-hydrolyzing) 1 [Burkholderia multivorans]MDR9023066.1 Asparagine synthetase (glutamine-hydrolyzing) 1 [Burkholderia mu
MCGIDGFLNSVAFDEETARGTLARMTASLAHRGPDAQGLWVDPAAGIALGHRRPAIVDLSVHGRQPMASACGRYVMVFNGEIYNHRELRAQLERVGRAPAWRGHSDTEVLLAAFAAWGVDATLRRATGMFALALWNRESRVLTLARDRIGEKPLYYGRIGDALVFASELKALRAYPGFDGEIDRDALCLYLRHSAVPAPHTIYRGIRKLPPGTWIQFEHAQDTPRIRTYWALEHAIDAGHHEPFAGTAAEAVDRLDTVLRQAVARQMEADVPLGAFLSGGVDSSAIVALMQAQSAAPVDTFTIGFHEAGYDEAGYAKAVARHLGTRHTELYVTADHALEVVPKLPAIYDEPFSDASQIPTFLVAELTRRHVKVSLSGDGGDELFGGYTRYFLTPRLWRKLHRVPAAVRTRIAGALHALRPDHADQLAAVAQGAWGAGELRESPTRIGDRLHKLGHVMTADSRIGLYRLLMSSVHHPERIALAGHEPPTPLDTASAWPAHLSFAEQAMAIDTLTYLPTDILTKVDRAAMAVSLETRMPFLDHHVVEFAWRLPASLRLPEGQSKALLRRLLDRYVPTELIDRPKQGFCAPIDHWLRGALRDWADALLQPSRLRDEGFFDAAAVERLWRQHQAGRMNWQHQLWTVLMFQAWLDAQRTA